MKPHSDYGVDRDLDDEELKELCDLLERPLRNIHRCISKGQMHQANAQMVAKVVLLTQELNRLLAPTTHRLEDEELWVSLQLTTEKKEEVLASVLEFFFERRQFSPEGVMQSDSCRLAAPELVADLADILGFEVNHKEEE